MPRRRLSFLLALPLILSVPAFASPAVPEPKLVRVVLGPSTPIARLLEAGLDVIDVRSATEVKILEWPGDEAKLARLGVASEILDEHPGQTAARRADAELAARGPMTGRRVRSATGPDGAVRIQTLPPFGSGSMGGYWTSAEIKMKLDDLVASDTQGLVADKVDTIGYSGGYAGSPPRPIWGLAIGKNFGFPDAPLSFFSAITHAREPEGMQALFYFVDDLISRYGTDPYATYLLDHRSLYIVPLVNPDGYKINEDYYTANHAFNYWRKNARDNDGSGTYTGLDGVDINRNYGYKWGLDNVGSSPNMGDETYRGPSAFSEPETRVQRDIVNGLQPVTGCSYHTYSDLMIHPWGYTTTPTPDHPKFVEWTDELTRDNGYLGGVAPAILYSVNGEFNDWCYGDNSIHPKMFSWTPEIGDDNAGFWPAPSLIVPLAQENLRMAYVIASIAGPWVQTDGFSIQEGNLNASFGAHVTVRARNLGVTGTAGPGLKGTMVPLDGGVRMLVNQVGYPTLASLTSGDPVAPFQLVVDDTITPGRLERFEIDFSASDGFFSRDTIAIPLGTPTVVAFDDASSGLGKWTVSGGWGIVSNDPNHPSRYFADSPSGAYGNGMDAIMLLTSPLNLSAGLHAYTLFESRWEYRQDVDAGSIEASPNGTTFTRLRGMGSTNGSGLGIQTSNQPYYAGSHRLWKPELVDLSSFTGAGNNAVRLRFRSQVYNGGGFDGMNLDSVRIWLFDPAAQPAPVAVGGGDAPRALELAPPSPNPARGLARFGFALPRGGETRLEILDVAGRNVRSLANGRLEAGHYVRGWDRTDDRGRTVAPGIYLARLSTPEGVAVRRFAVLD
jgi:hypothetical protein